METNQQGIGPSTGEIGSTSTQGTGQGTGRLSQRAHETVDRMASTAHGMADRVSSHGEQWMARQDEVMQQVRSYVRDRPIAALAMAAAVGFVLSRLSR